MKRKNGFTLIELLVVIAIIGSLSVVIGINATQLTNNAKENNYLQTYKDIFDSASVYSELSVSSCESGCIIYLQKLIDKGLLDIKILDEENPLFKESTKFKSNDKITVSFENGKKILKFVSGSCLLNENNLNSDFKDWGKC